MNLMYNFEYYKKMIVVFLIPVLLITVLFAIGMAIYSLRSKEKNQKYHYNMNFISYLLGIITMAFLTAFAVGFAYSLITMMIKRSLDSTYKILYISSYIFPFIPATFLIFFIRKFCKNIKDNAGINKQEKITTEQDSEELL